MADRRDVSPAQIVESGLVDGPETYVTNRDQSDEERRRRGFRDYRRQQWTSLEIEIVAIIDADGRVVCRYSGAGQNSRLARPPAGLAVAMVLKEFGGSRFAGKRTSGRSTTTAGRSSSWASRGVLRRGLHERLGRQERVCDQRRRLRRRLAPVLRPVPYRRRRAGVDQGYSPSKRYVKGRLEKPRRPARRIGDQGLLDPRLLHQEPIQASQAEGQAAAVGGVH